jgi:hypothetical protein
MGALRRDLVARTKPALHKQFNERRGIQGTRRGGDGRAFGIDPGARRIPKLCGRESATTPKHWFNRTIRPKHPLHWKDDREFDNSTNQTGWAITDGSAGLRGEVIKSDNLADIKLFAATFLSGAASALTEKQQTIFGPINSPTLNNAPFAGAQAVLQTYAQQIFDSIQKNGFYVRVPSGKQFYLYVLQTIDDADASLGGTAIPVTQENDEQLPTKSRP